jgi:hypothetical protein
MSTSEVPAWLEAAVWLDYKVAVALTVMVPLLLLGWAFLIRMRPLIQLMTIYWRVSSLLAITVYLMIAGFPISFLTGTLARLLIPVSLWFWQDLNEGISSWGGGASQAFRVWRWLLSGYMAMGFLSSVAFVPCAFRQPLSEICRVWFQPPLGFRDIFHPGVPVATLGMVGVMGLVTYGLYSVYFLWRLNQRVGLE